MPAQPVWYHRLHDILAHLASMKTSHLDRLAVQKLFAVRERRARQIMGGLPCIQVGNAIAVERAALIGFVRAIARGESFQRETVRRGRLVEELERTRLHLTARQVSISAAPAGEQPFAEGIELRPGELRITFDGAEDLAAKLFALSKSMASDWPNFKRLAEIGSSGEAVSSSP